MDLQLSSIIVLWLGALLCVGGEAFKEQTSNLFRAGKISSARLFRVMGWCKKIILLGWIVGAPAFLVSVYVSVTQAKVMPSTVGMAIGFIFGTTCLVLSYNAQKSMVDKPDFKESPEKYSNLDRWQRITAGLGAVIVLYSLQSLATLLYNGVFWRAYF